MLRHELNQEVIELAHLAHEIGTDLSDLDVDSERIAELRDRIHSIDELVEEIDDEFAGE